MKFIALFAVVVAADPITIKKCYPNMKGKAIHHGIHAAQGNFGDTIPSGLSVNTATLTQCQERCEAISECRGYSFRRFAYPYICYLHNSVDIQYAPTAATNGGFDSGVCQEYTFNKPISRDGKTYIKNCFGNGLMLRKALHHGIHANIGSFGSTLSHTLGHTEAVTTEACAQECQNNDQCFGWSFRRFAWPYICYLHPEEDLTSDITPANNGGFDSAYCTENEIISEPVEMEMTIEETPETFTAERRQALIDQIAAEMGVSAADVTITTEISRRLLDDGSRMKIIVSIAVHYEENNAEALAESVQAVAVKIVQTIESPTFQETVGATFIGFKEQPEAEQNTNFQAFQTALQRKVTSARALNSVEGSDRQHYSPTDTKQCCQTDCQSQPAPIRVHCAKGCERWIAHTSLNWQLSNRVALNNQCKHACSNEAGPAQTQTFGRRNRANLYSAALASNEEPGCRVGCDIFDVCSYEKLEN
jgi:hypothetical protein